VAASYVCKRVVRSVFSGITLCALLHFPSYKFVILKHCMFQEIFLYNVWNLLWIIFWRNDFERLEINLEYKMFFNHFFKNVGVIQFEIWCCDQLFDHICMTIFYRKKYWSIAYCRRIYAVTVTSKKNFDGFCVSIFARIAQYNIVVI
jgi:hypothetical protein